MFRRELRDPRLQKVMQAFQGMYFSLFNLMYVLKLLMFSAIADCVKFYKEKA